MDELKSGRLEPGQSVLEAIEHASGRKSRVLLRDVPDEHAPLIRVVKPGSDEEAEDDRRYLTLGEIARGGVGVVFKSRDKDLGRDVAVKMLSKRLCEDPEIVERFVEEAQITGQLHNPGIVPVYDIGLQPDGRPYFVMKLVKGRTLAALLEERASTSAERRKFLSVFEQVCRTAGYAHARGVIHRDLKPSNIMLGAFGEVQVVDWGFAKVLDPQREDAADDESERRLPTPDMSIISTVRTGEGSSHSIAGSVMGTPAYMPPEQAMGLIDRLDERSDVFSLGAILCEILTGRPPYVGDPGDLLILAAQAKLDDAHARLDTCGAHAELTDLARRCLQPLRRDRPANATELADALSEHLAGVEERAKRAELVAADERANQKEEEARLEREAAVAQWERQARRRVLVLAAVVLLAVVLGGGGYFLTQRDRESQAQKTLVAIRDAENEARLLEGQAQWSAATAAAERAAQLAADLDSETRGRTEALRGRLREQQRAVAAEKAQAERDALLVDRLAEIQAQGLRGRSLEETIKEYGFAFADHDLDIKSLDPASRATIARAVMTALDEMELLAKDKQGIRQAILAADRDPWRTRVRKLHYAGDVDGLGKVKTEGQPAENLALLGHALLAHRRPATKVLLDAYFRFPSDYRIVVLLADAYALQKDWVPAARLLTAALALRPTSMALRNRLGLALAHAGDLDAAVTTLQEGKLAGLDMEGYCQLGLVLARKGDRQGAIDAFREAMREQPRAARPHHQLGMALLGSFSDYEAAIVAFKDALRLEPNSAEVYRALGEAYDGNGDAKRALEAIDKALELQSDFAAARVSRGIVLAGQQRYHDAIGEFMRATVDDSDGAAAYYQLARAYLATGRYSGVSPVLEVAVHRGYSGRDVNLLRGLAHEGLGNSDEAIEAISLAVKATKDYAEAICHLGRVTFRTGDWKRGLALSRRGHELGQARGARWSYPSAEQLARQERQALIAASIDTAQPSVDLAAVHFFAKRYSDALRVYSALDALPAGEARVRAAAAALREGSPRARSWMQAELEHWSPRVLKGDPVAFRTLMDWKEGWRLKPAAGKKEWAAFWAVVDKTLAEAER
ncbi:MAG: protein kinase domain-containing protein [Planctomycetota bacterium]